MAKGTETVRRQLDALNKHDVSTFASLYGQDASVFDPAYPEPLRGRKAVEKDMEEFISAFPDVQMKIERVVEDAGTTAYEIRMSGTHKGPFTSPTGHVPATNKAIDIGGAIISRVDDQGRIIEERRYYDLAGLLGQIGLLQ